MPDFLAEQSRAAHDSVVIVLIPIAFFVPTTLMFIPPLPPLSPATLPGIVQFPALVVCHHAVRSVSSDCLVEFMFCVSDPALTSVEGFCLKARHCGAKQNRRENDQREKRFSDSVH